MHPQRTWHRDSLGTVDGVFVAAELDLLRAAAFNICELFLAVGVLPSSLSSTFSSLLPK